MGRVRWTETKTAEVEFPVAFVARQCATTQRTELMGSSWRFATHPHSVLQPFHPYSHLLAVGHLIEGDSETRHQEGRAV